MARSRGRSRAAAAALVAAAMLAGVAAAETPSSAAQRSLKACIKQSLTCETAQCHADARDCFMALKHPLAIGEAAAQALACRAEDPLSKELATMCGHPSPKAMQMMPSSAKKRLSRKLLAMDKGGCDLMIDQWFGQYDDDWYESDESDSFDGSSFDGSYDDWTDNWVDEFGSDGSGWVNYGFAQENLPNQINFEDYHPGPFAKVNAWNYVAAGVIENEMDGHDSCMIHFGPNAPPPGYFPPGYLDSDIYDPDVFAAGGPVDLIWGRGDFITLRFRPALPGSFTGFREDDDDDEYDRGMDGYKLDTREFRPERPNFVYMPRQDSATGDVETGLRYDDWIQDSDRLEEENYRMMYMYDMELGPMPFYAMTAYFYADGSSDDVAPKIIPEFLLGEDAAFMRGYSFQYVIDDDDDDDDDDDWSADDVWSADDYWSTDDDWSADDVWSPDDDDDWAWNWDDDWWAGDDGDDIWYDDWEDPFSSGPFPFPYGHPSGPMEPTWPHQSGPFGSGPFGSGPHGSGPPSVCRAVLREMLYLDAVGQVVSERCYPDVHGARRCDDPDSYDFIFQGERYWAMGEASDFPDFVTCENANRPRPGPSGPPGFAP